MQFKIEQINEAGGIRGRKVELVIYDNTGDTQKCGAILQLMIDDGIQFIVGPVLSQMAEITTRTVAGKDVLLVTPTMSTDYLTGKDDNIIRTSANTTQQGHLLAQYAHKKNIKTIAVIYDLSNKKYTEFLYKAFKKKAEEYGMSVPLVLTIDKTQTPEMPELAQKMAQTNPDGVLTCLSAVDAANLAQNLKKIGLSPQLLGVSWSQTDDLLLHGGRAVEDMVLISTRQYGVENTLLEKFRKQFKERFKKEPSFVNVKGYDGMTLLQYGLEHAPELTPSQVRKTLLEAKDVQGAEKDLSLDQYGDSLSGYFLVKVTNGQFINEE